MEIRVEVPVRVSGLAARPKSGVMRIVRVSGQETALTQTEIPGMEVSTPVVFYVENLIMALRSLLPEYEIQILPRKTSDSSSPTPSVGDMLVDPVGEGDPSEGTILRS